MPPQSTTIDRTAPRAPLFALLAIGVAFGGLLAVATLAAPRASSATPAPATCRLTVELRDAASRETLPGLIRVRGADGATVAIPELLERGLGLSPAARELRWHVLTGRTTITVPRETIELECFSGIETARVTRRLELDGRETATVEVDLRRIVDASDRGLRGGNTHLHLMKVTREEADRYLREVPRADGLDVLFVSYLERLRDDLHYVSNSYTAADLAALSGGGVLLGNGEEHRHNFESYGEGFGHVMFLDLPRLVHPVSIGPGITGHGTDGVPLRRGIETAHGLGATAIWCHNTFGHEDIPDWVAGILDAQNIFDGGAHGSYADTFYRYLAIGLRVPFSTGTDWFIDDFSRVYVEIDGELSIASWLRGLAAGRSFITNGTFLDLEVDGRRPGAVISLDEPASVRVAGRAIGRNDFGRVEVIHDGAIASGRPSTKAAGRFEAALDMEIELERPGWIALRIPTAGENELGRPLFAHTSPVYVDIAGKRTHSPDVARDLIAEMERSIETIEQAGRFANAVEREGIIAIYREAIERLR